MYTKTSVSHEGGETLLDFADKLGRVPLLHDPGQRWCYSLATDVCGALVEIISGQPFESFLQERILGPGHGRYGLPGYGRTGGSLRRVLPENAR